MQARLAQLIERMALNFIVVGSTQPRCFRYLFRVGLWNWRIFFNRFFYWIWFNTNFHQKNWIIWQYIHTVCMAVFAATRREATNTISSHLGSLFGSNLTLFKFSPPITCSFSNRFNTHHFSKLVQSNNGNRVFLVDTLALVSIITYICMYTGPGPYKRFSYPSVSWFFIAIALTQFCIFLLLVIKQRGVMVDRNCLSYFIAFMIIFLYVCIG